jgi:hypothetical protein
MFPHILRVLRNECGDTTRTERELIVFFYFVHDEGEGP